jgi:hypothetical protein
MSYCITEVRHKAFPDAATVSKALSSVGIGIDELVGTFTGYVCALTPGAGRGFHSELADSLKSHLEHTWQRAALRATRQRHDLAYSRTLNEHADFGLVHVASNRRVLFEVEFGPNYERDLINFQVGANEGILAVAVLLVPIDRATAGSSLIGIADYESVLKVITALRPTYPLLVVGLRGSQPA